MRKGLFFFTVLALVLSTGLAQAGDKEDIIAATDGVIAAWHASDVDAIQKHYASDFTQYGVDGNLLRGGWDWVGLGQWFESGGKVTTSPLRHPEVKVYGNTAVLTTYGTITVTQPDGTATTTTHRNTIVWVKQSGQWKAVHSHASLLTPQQ